MGETWGTAPPYGAYRHAYSDYVTAQCGSLGSGLLGGASVAADGQFIDDDGASVSEARAERRRILGLDPIAPRASTTPESGAPRVPQTATRRRSEPPPLHVLPGFSGGH